MAAQLYSDQRGFVSRLLEIASALHDASTIIVQVSALVKSLIAALTLQTGLALQFCTAWSAHS